MDRLSGKVAVITGASAGIGLATAKALIRNGMTVIGLARRKAKMEAGMKDVKGSGKFCAMECDVTKNDDVAKVFNDIKNVFGSVHVLVNNAGLMNKGSTAELDVQKIEQVINTNLLGLVYCTREAVKIMKEGNQEGHIINIGSIFSHKVFYVEGFSMNLYPATKFAVRGFSESLQNELRGTNIRVTHVSSGVVKTEFFEVAGTDPIFLETFPGLESEDVADALVYLIGTKSYVHIPELGIRHLQDYFR